MNFYELGLKNVTQNFQAYLIYFISVIFNVIIYYTFVSFGFNTHIEKLISTDTRLFSLFLSASSLISILSFLFIWYSTSFFIKKRKKEIGLYYLIGMRKREISTMLFYENIITGILALLIGIILGGIFYKLFLMIFVKFLGLSINIKFSLSLKAIIKTILTFSIIFFVNSIYVFSLVYRQQLVELFRAHTKGEKEPKTSLLLGLTSIIILFLGYKLGLRIDEDPLTFISSSFSALFFSIIGTFMFFKFFLIYIVKAYKKNKKFYYKSLNMIATSHLLYRIKTNAKTFSIIAILCATTLTALGTTYCFYYNIKNQLDTEFLFSYSYITNDTSIDKKFEDIVAKNKNHEIQNSFEAHLIKINDFKSTSPSLNKILRDKIHVISESKFKELAKLKNLKETISLKNTNDTIILLYSLYEKKTDFKNTLINIDNYSFKISNTVDHSLFNNDHIGPTMVVKDSVFEELRYHYNTIRAKGYIVSNILSSERLTDTIQANFSEDIKFEYPRWITSINIISTLLFIGIFLAFISLISTSSFIYFKQLNEANEDKERYLILRRIGVNKKEIKKSIKQQLFIIFFAPLVLGMSHSIVALSMLAKLMKANLIVPSVITLAIYAFIYILYYLVTVKSYLKIIYEK